MLSPGLARATHAMRATTHCAWEMRRDLTMQPSNPEARGSSDSTPHLPSGESAFSAEPFVCTRLHVKVKEQFASESQCVYMDERTLLQRHASVRDCMWKVKRNLCLNVRVCVYVYVCVYVCVCRLSPFSPPQTIQYPLGGCAQDLTIGSFSRRGSTLL